MNAIRNDSSILSGQNLTPSSPSAGILIISGDSDRARIIERQLRMTLHVLPSTDIQPLKSSLALLTQRQFSLLVIDAQDPEMDPLHAIKQIHLVAEHTPLILISAANDPIVASRALRAGASAYLAGHDLPAYLGVALNQIKTGERFVTDEVMQGILHDMVDSVDQNRLPIETLSDREMVVFQAIGKSKTLRMIADELGVNIKTVATHCNNIRRKLHTADNRRLGLVSKNWMISRQETEAHHQR